MDHHGSLSIDLLFATFILLIIIVTTANLISDRFNLVDESDELSEARSLAEYIAGSVNQVYAGGNGHKIKISIPYQLNKNHNYEVKVNGSGVLIDLNGRKGLAYIIPEKISADENNLKNSTIILYPGNSYYMINKKEGKGDNWIVILHE